jgi:hypothetical protein
VIGRADAHARESIEVGVDFVVVVVEVAVDFVGVEVAVGLKAALASLPTKQPRAGLRPSLAAAQRVTLLLAVDAASSNDSPTFDGAKGR